jgi:uncharacterized protein YecT (DUF1311 family)
LRKLILAVVATAAIPVGSSFLVRAATSDPQPAPMVAGAAASAEESERRRGDIARLETCLATVKGSRGGERCVGLVARACVAERASGADAERATADCQHREAAAWSELADRFRLALVRTVAGDPAKARRIDAGQRAWLTERQQRCAAAYEGAVAPFNLTALSACDLRETSRRVLYLRLLAAKAGAA